MANLTKIFHQVGSLGQPRAAGSARRVLKPGSGTGAPGTALAFLALRGCHGAKIAYPLSPTKGESLSAGKQRAWPGRSQGVSGSFPFPPVDAKHRCIYNLDSRGFGTGK